MKPIFRIVRGGTFRNPRRSMVRTEFLRRTGGVSDADDLLDSTGSGE